MNRKMVRYAGFKEELYVGDFEPDPRVLARLGLKRRPRVVVVARTPPEGTLYHRSSNPLFERAVRVVCAQADTVCVLLPRTDAQADAVQRLGLANCIVPDGAIDSRSLMYAADAMIGAGGTMTREAALMGIPTWTVFAGDAPAVDTALQQRGLLHRLTDPTALAALAPRAAVPASPQLLRERADLLIDEIVSATLATRRWRSRSTGESGRPGATRRPPGTASPPPPTSTEP
jgi:predicted glycosyltransferase